MDGSPDHGGRRRSVGAALARAGVGDPARAESWFEELAGYGIGLEPGDLAPLADPDAALLAMVRLASAKSGPGLELLSEVLADPDRRLSCLALFGGSVALGEHLIRHPEALSGVPAGADAESPAGPGDLGAGGGDGLAPKAGTASGETVPVNQAEAALANPAEATNGRQTDPTEPTAAQLAIRARLLEAVGADPASARPVAAGPECEPLRLAYRNELLAIAAGDLAHARPVEVFEEVSRALADLATGVLEAALSLARVAVSNHELADLSVIAMGKTGGRELNYVSDVDVIYVCEPSSGDVSEARAMEIGTQLAIALQRACAAPAKEPVIWQVDPNLRPEGKNGPLVRTLASHQAYLEKWAQTWEFQALLKARPAAGDAALGRAYIEMTRPLVWQAAGRDNFVLDTQAMRRRVEQHLPAGEAAREIKLGRGGLRDVEFTVQMLQLVHGRTDPALRSPTTLTALAQLSESGYVGRSAASQLAECYRLERTLEHRIQLRRLRRTHLLPESEVEQRILARAARLSPATSQELAGVWKATRLQVRSLHEELYYRPLLPQTASLTPGEAQLAPEAARARLTALGYRDPEGAMRHIAALTQGVSRRSSIMRQLLPVIMGWLAEGADPDSGLLSFRQLSEALGATPWFLRLLRDKSGAAERLSHVLAASKWVADSLTRSPEAAAWFGQDADLAPRPLAEMMVESDAVLQRHQEVAPATEAVRALRRRELSRIGAGQVVGQVSDLEAYQATSDAAEVALVSALRLAKAVVAENLGDLPARVAVVAMGSLGGREMALGSDADVLFVHQAVPGADPAAASAAAVAVAKQVKELLGGLGPEPALVVDPDLRPEGRSGPLTRSVEAYRDYYQRWAQPWERQALLRARLLAGDDDVAGEFMSLADSVRYQAGGLPPADLRELRLVKARVEAERLPRGIEPARHLKLGPGGLLDVQWVAQLYQLRFAHGHPALQVTATLDALEACAAEGLIELADVEVLTAAWRQAMAIRQANALWTGRVNPACDHVPSDQRHLAGIAALLSRESGLSQQIAQDWARAARRARKVFERLFFD
ncbi:MAG: bifunctional [glutamine synthetase] adenylyltransferase/[glutamine synthetase]-adenylyl-L-tyrosine phosphorylase [Micrococcales bacterium]|nr:bifunctional [glutamine synthetase] adenylyltransferase/[glutamine synthetase]-adenylyl-L-tyrosine phosphorylase [Micrococcales bacterium]